MGIVPEKNDVDISKLFTWGKEGVIFDVDNNEIMKFYIRLIGDADINQARVHALRKSAEIRKKLRETQSDEYLAYIPDFEVVSKEQLIGALLMLKAKEIGENVAKEVKVPFPSEPDSDATLEAQEAYQKELDDYPNKVNKEIEEKVRAQLEKEDLKIKGLDKEILFEEYKAYMVNDICEKTMYEDFKNSCVYYGTYKDSSCEERLFTSSVEVGSFPSEIKKQFVDAYSELEINTDFLKKLQGATQS